VSDYRELRPSPPLAPYVRCFWVARTSPTDVAAGALQPVLPDGCMDVILARHGTERDGRDAFALTAVGTMTRWLDAVPLPLRLGVRFEPGMGPLFLRAPAPRLTDAEVPLADVCGEDARRLLGELADRPSLAARIATLERWLLRRLERAAPVDADVHAVVGRIVAAPDRGRVGPLAGGAGLGERQLRRRFEAAVGVGPKRFARIVRLQNALRLAASGAGSWAQVALDAGYYDQAHLIGEFRSLAGRTPRVLRPGPT
jgi:AraC-like DNA-binding protein